MTRVMTELWGEHLVGICSVTDLCWCVSLWFSSNISLSLTHNLDKLRLTDKGNHVSHTENKPKKFFFNHMHSSQKIDFPVFEKLWETNGCLCLRCSTKTGPSFPNTSTRQHTPNTRTMMISIVEWFDPPYAVGGGREHQEEDENQQDARDSRDWREISRSESRETKSS